MTDHADLLFPTIISRCQRIGFPRLEDSFVQEWLRGKMVKESDIPLLTGLSSGNIHQSRYLIAQPVNHLINLINDLITTLISDNPDQWRNFIQTYSRIATQDPAMFSFHFMLLKIWFRSANRFRKGVNDLLHTTSFKPMMEGLINVNRNADFSAITTWGVFYPEEEKPANLILLDCVKERYEFPELRRVALDQYKYWKPEMVIIEAKASGLPLTLHRRRKRPGVGCVYW